jgi:hypothetical protein
MKRLLSSFAGRTGTAFQIPLTANTLSYTIDKYISDFGTQNVHLHRLFDISGTDATSAVYGLNKSKWRVAWLRPVHIEELAKTGDAEKRMIIGELTLECLNEPTNFELSGFKRAIS